MSRHRFRMAPVVALTVLAAACGGGEATTADATATDTEAAETTEAASPDDAGDDTAMDDETAMDDMDMDEEMDMSGDDGEPADAAEADRTIEVNVDNEFAFDPDEFEVAEGEVVTFRITNSGDIEHEFVLGDEAAQQQMEEAMASGEGHEHSGDMSNAVTIHAGETAELTWRFTTAGTVLVGCHVPGHYDAGMVGTVTVG